MAARPFILHPSSFRLNRSAISLIEVLISMFVLLFGLLGVAAIIPVGNHYVVEGEKFDLGAALAQNAFEELRARGVLRPEVWIYPFNPEGGGTTAPIPVINDATNAFSLNGTPSLAGHAFVIDPIGVGDALLTGISTDLDVFPRVANGPDVAANAANPWNPAPTGSVITTPLPGERWPVRRITLPIPTGLMSKTVAETIFRLRDDLTVEQPDAGDVPSIQLWDVDATTGNLLRRQYQGDYSWLATIVPENADDLAALQPSVPSSGNVTYDVSVVVFRKRVDTPDGANERVINAELLPGGELIIYSSQPEVAARAEVDAALDDIRTGNWISLMGVNQITGDFVMKWYRILSLDDDESGTQPITLPSGAGTVFGRRLTLIGSDWPATPGANFIANLRAGILPGVISVVTKPLQMEEASLWSLE